MALLDDLLALNKSRRKILLALIGLVTAIVAAVGGGQAVQIALSYQDNSNTAKNGGVVTGDIQGAGVAINTGSGDIIQHQGQGNIVQHKGQGDINIGIRLNEYEAGLQRREREVRQALHQAHAKEREGLAQKLQDLEKEKSEIARRLADTESCYRISRS